MLRTISETVWHHYQFADCKPHVVSAELRVPLLRDLEIRYAHKGICTDSAITLHWHFDLHAILAKEPVDSFDLYGLEITAPTKGMAATVYHLSHLPIRQFENGVCYKKIESGKKCLALTLLQASLLCRQMETRIKSR